MTTPLAITSEIQKLEPSAIIELFVLDLSTLGGDVYYFHAGTNELRANITWQGQEYTRFPIEVEGFEHSGNGQLPRPKAKVSNTFGSITSLLLAFKDLIGAKLTRKRTLKKYLDAVNFPGGLNPDEDDTASFVDDVYFVDRKVNENKVFVEFELASNIDLAGVKLPRRQIIQNVCVWKYRSAECSFAGAPVLDANDQPLTTYYSPQGKTLVETYAAYVAARDLFKAKESLLADALAAKEDACSYKFVSSEYSNPSNVAVPVRGVAISGGNVYYFWDSVAVSPPSYRLGAFVSYLGSLMMYEIEKWEVNSSSCSIANGEYLTALSDRNSAKADMDAALALYETALAELPPDDPLYKYDRCGKRLSSCKLRFGETSQLPYGSFPAASLIK